MGIKNATIEMNSVRPLAALASEIEQEFKRIVTYEDPAFTQVDGSSGESKMNPGAGPGTFNVDSADTPKSILEKGIKLYNKTASGASFNLRESKYGFHLYPDYTTGEDAAPAGNQSLLQARVEIGAMTATGYKVLEKIIEEWNKSVDQQIQIGTIPTNLFLGKTITSAPHSSNVNDCLIDLFLKMGRALSWQLLNIPNTHQFVLNIHMV